MSKLDMEQSRANIISEVHKNVANLGKNIKKTTGLNVKQNNAANAFGTPVAGSGFVRILMYFIAGILALGIILLAVDQLVTPVFQKGPGSGGYIPMPGSDMTETYWQSLADVGDILVGVPPPRTDSSQKVKTVEVLEGQSSYSITMDVFIEKEYPQDLGGLNQRIFFIMSQTVINPTLQISLDNSKNTLFITCFDSNGYQQSIVLDNVPIHTPFRIGVTMSQYAMEGYLNGLLVKTRQLDVIPKTPSTGDKIFSPSNIKLNGKSMSSGITVLNVRCFGYVASAPEMKGRMGDLFGKASFTKKLF
jgi:hypothetical protein